MEESYKITRKAKGEVKVSIDALQGPNNIKKLLQDLATDDVKSIGFTFTKSIEIDFLLLQIIALLGKNGKKISIDGIEENPKVMNQILQNIII